MKISITIIAIIIIKAEHSPALIVLKDEPERVIFINHPSKGLIKM